MGVGVSSCLSLVVEGNFIKIDIEIGDGTT